MSRKVKNLWKNLMLYMNVVYDVKSVNLRQLPVKLLRILESLLTQCCSCIRWNSVTTVNFAVNFGVRQGSVMSPFLFAIYLDDLCRLCVGEHSRFVVVYADDIMLISPSVVETERLLHACENELNSLDVLLCNCCICCMYRFNRFKRSWLHQ